MLGVLPVAAVFLTPNFPMRHWSRQLRICKGQCFYCECYPCV